MNCTCFSTNRVDAIFDQDTLAWWLVERQVPGGGLNGRPQKLERKRDSSLAYHMTAHLRMNGVYWGVCALELMGASDALDRNALVDFVLSCYDETTGAW